MITHPPLCLARTPHLQHLAKAILLTLHSVRASWLSRSGDDQVVFGGDEGSMLEAPLLGGDEERRTRS